MAKNQNVSLGWFYSGYDSILAEAVGEGVPAATGDHQGVPCTGAGVLPGGFATSLSVTCVWMTSQSKDERRVRNAYELADLFA